MSPEIEHQFYLAVCLGMFTGAFLLWAIPFAIPTILKVRQERIEEGFDYYGYLNIVRF